MKLNVYVAFNQFLGCSGQPIFDDHEPEVFSKQFERFLLTKDDAQVFQYENVSFYFIGSFDDETMKFDVQKNPLKLLDCNIVLETRKIKAKLLDAARQKEIEESKDGK